MQSLNKTKNKKQKLLKFKMSFTICEYLIERHFLCTSRNKTIVTNLYQKIYVEL